MVFFKWRRGREWEVLDRGLKGAGVLLGCSWDGWEGGSVPRTVPRAGPWRSSSGHGGAAAPPQPLGWQRGGRKGRGWCDTAAAPGTRRPWCASPRPAGQRPEMQATVMSQWQLTQPQLWGVCWPPRAPRWLLRDGQDREPAGASSPRLLAGSEVLPVLVSAGRSSGSALLTKCSIHPISRTAEPFQACFVAWKRGRFELWRFRICFLPRSCKGHLSQHIVVKF